MGMVSMYPLLPLQSHMAPCPSACRVFAAFYSDPFRVSLLTHGPSVPGPFAYMASCLLTEPKSLLLGQLESRGHIA